MISKHCILKRKRDVVREHILKYYGSMLSPHERKMKQVQKVPQFNQSTKNLQKKKSKKDKSFYKSRANLNSNKKVLKQSQKEIECETDDLTKEMNELCENDRLKCQDEVQKNLSQRFEQQFLDVLQEPVQAQDINYTQENALDKLFSSFKSVKIQHDLDYDSLFFNSTKDKNYDSVKFIQNENFQKEKFFDETTNDKSHSFLKNKIEKKEYEEVDKVQVPFNNVELLEKNSQKEDSDNEQQYQQQNQQIDYLNDQKLDQLIQQQSEKFEQSFDAQTKFSKMFDKYRKKSQESDDKINAVHDEKQINKQISEEDNQHDDFLKLEKELNITQNDSVEQEKQNQKKEKYDSSKFIPAQIEHIQQQQEDEEHPRIPTFGDANITKDFQENFDLQHTEENQDILQEINRIYKNSQTQCNVESIKSQYKSNGTFNFSQQDFLEKQQDLSKIIEEGDEKQIEEEQEDLEEQDEDNQRAEVFTLGGPNLFQESKREVAYTVEQLPDEIPNHNTMHNNNAYYSDAVQFQTKPKHDTKNFKSMPEQKDLSFDEEQIRQQKMDELIETMLRKKVQRIIQCWRNYKSPLNQKKYVGRFFDLYWNTYYDEELVEAFNEGQKLTIFQLQKIKNEFWFYLKQNMNISRKDFEEEMRKLSFFN